MFSISSAAGCRAPNHRACGIFARQIIGFASLAILLLTIPSAAFTQQVAIIEHRLPAGGSSRPEGIAVGPDGALWFVESQGNRIGRITTAGMLTEYPLPAVSSYPRDITAGPDGALWFTESPGNRIGRISTTGVITEYPLPAADSGPEGITAGPDGALWFAEHGAASIGRITTSGVITEYALPSVDSTPYDITPGPDGALWFTDTNGRVGRITIAGAVTEFPLPNAGSNPWGIVAGPDGAIWFAENFGKRIGRITTTGVITEYPLPAGSQPAHITEGPDGALWFTEWSGNKVGRITTAGVITEYPQPAFGSSKGITAGPDGALWFSEYSGGMIGQLVFPTAVLSANPDKGSPFTAVTVTGGGFAADETVNLYVNSTGANLLGTATADASGFFEVTGRVRQAPYGPLSLVGVGQGSGNLGVAGFTVTARLIMDPAAAAPGSTVKAQGFGFGAGEPVVVWWITPRVRLGTATANDRGSFLQDTAVTFTVPPDAAPGIRLLVGIGQVTGAIGKGYVTVQ